MITLSDEEYRELNRRWSEARDVAYAVRKAFIRTCEEHCILLDLNCLKFPWDKEE